MLFAIVGFAMTMFEYGSSHPSLVEFRFAPPFNRVRFISLFLTVLLVSLMFRGEIADDGAAKAVFLAGYLIGVGMDFPFSPVRLFTDLLTDHGTTANTDIVRSIAGLGYVVSLVSLAVFAVLIRIGNWPIGHGNFNMWINLPTFDPAKTFDVEVRLARDARVNLIFGFTLPFLVPAVAQVSSNYYDFGGIDSNQTLIWTVAVWSFLPASLFMRGIAMGKIAQLIRRKREKLTEPGTGSFAAA